MIFFNFVNLSARVKTLFFWFLVVHPTMGILVMGYHGYINLHEWIVSYAKSHGLPGFHVPQSLSPMKYLPKSPGFTELDIVLTPTWDCSCYFSVCVYIYICIYCIYIYICIYCIYIYISGRWFQPL